MPDNSDQITRPPVSFIFQLSFGGKEDDAKIGFQEASGISQDMNTEEVGCGGENRFKYRLPGVVKYNNLVLKRGLVAMGSTLSQWCSNTLETGLAAAIETKDITVALLDMEGKILVSWDFINAYPVKWDVSDFKSQESQLAIESVEFAYNYFKKN